MKRKLIVGLVIAWAAGTLGGCGLGFGVDLPSANESDAAGEPTGDSGGLDLEDSGDTDGPDDALGGAGGGTPCGAKFIINAASGGGSATGGASTSDTSDPCPTR